MNVRGQGFWVRKKNGGVKPVGKTSSAGGRWRYALLAAVMLMMAYPAYALDTKSEGEAMTVNSGEIVKVLNASDASGGKELAYYTNGSASKGFSGAISKIVVRARGDQCDGAPRMKVSVDDVQVGLSDVSNTARADFTYGVDVGAGSHTLKIDYINDYRSAVCDRDLMVDYYILTQPDPTPKPTSCSVGQFEAEYRNEAKQFASQPVLQRCEETPFNNSWGLGSPGPGVNADNFTVRWIGQRAFESGDYEFSVTSNDGVRLYVDGQILIDQWKDRPLTTYAATKTMTAGNHEVKVEYYEGVGTAVARASWNRVNASSPPSGGEAIALGAYIQGAPWNASLIDDYAALTGEMPAAVMWMQPWQSQYPDHIEFREDLMDAVASRGATPIVMWGPGTWSFSDKNQPDYQLNDITNGLHDAYIRQWAREAAAWGKPFYLRLAWEHNGYWFHWSPYQNGNGGPAEYVAMWRHVHDIFQQEGATNARFYWTVSTEDTDWRVLPSEQTYPGDAYVDAVGIDTYNRGLQPSWANWWVEFEASIDGTYDKRAALTERPIMVAETSSVEAGGNKAAWIREAFLNDVPNRFPRVVAVNWWYQPTPAYDWRVDTSQSSLDAYREVVASPLYAGRLPQ